MTRKSQVVFSLLVVILSDHTHVSLAERGEGVQDVQVYPADWGEEHKLEFGENPTSINIMWKFKRLAVQFGEHWHPCVYAGSLKPRLVKKGRNYEENEYENRFNVSCEIAQVGPSCSTSKTFKATLSGNLEDHPFVRDMCCSSSDIAKKEHNEELPYCEDLIAEQEEQITKLNTRLQALREEQARADSQGPKKDENGLLSTISAGVSSVSIGIVSRLSWNRAAAAEVSVSGQTEPLDAAGVGAAAEEVSIFKALDATGKAKRMKEAACQEKSQPEDESAISQVKCTETVLGKTCKDNTWNTLTTGKTCREVFKDWCPKGTEIGQSRSCPDFAFPSVEEMRILRCSIKNELLPSDKKEANREMKNIMQFNTQKIAKNLRMMMKLKRNITKLL